MLELRLDLPRKSFSISVEIEVHTHSIFCLFGPSATGKSSILSAIAGFETGYRHAYLAVDGKVLTNTSTKSPPWQRGIGYMEQSARLFPHLTVKQNILYGAPQGSEDSWIAHIVESLDLRDYLCDRPQQLSGGLTQRVALARALAARPRVLLLDEPFSALDWMARRDLQNFVLNIHQKFPLTILLVTHQLTEAQRMAHTIALMDRGQILQTGTPGNLMESPASWRAAQLLGYTSLLQSSNGDQYAIHPDRVVLGQDEGLGIVIEGKIEQIIWNEGRKRAHLSLGAPWQASGRLEVNLAPTDDVHIGEHIYITFIHPPQMQTP